MKLIRFFFYCLIACNIGLAALVILPVSGVDLLAPTGERDRVSRQLTPERIQILPFVEKDAPKEPPKNAQEPAPGPAEPAASQTAQTSVSSAPLCVALNGMSADLVRQARDAAEQLGNGITTREIGVGNVSYWVNIPPNGGKEAADRRSEILKQEGIEDYFIVRDPGANQFAISLGLYRAEELARRRVEALAKKGIKTARISLRDGSAGKARVEVTGPGNLVENFARQFSEAHKPDGVTNGSCQPA